MAFWNSKKKTKNADNTDNLANTDNTENISGSRQQENTRAGSVESVVEEIALDQQEKFSSVDRKDQKRLVRECCESAMENDRQISEAKKEYEKITSHLSDIQKIDRISGTDRKSVV